MEKHVKLNDKLLTRKINFKKFLELFLKIQKKIIYKSAMFGNLVMMICCLDNKSWQYHLSWDVFIWYSRWYSYITSDGSLEKQRKEVWFPSSFDNIFIYIYICLLDTYSCFRYTDYYNNIKNVKISQNFVCKIKNKFLNLKTNINYLS